MAKAKPAAQAVTINRKDFIARAKLVAMAAHPHSGVPVLQFAKLGMAGQDLQVQCTDLDIALTATLPAEGSIPSLVAPIARIVRVARSMQTETMTLAPAEGGRIEIASADRSVVVRLLCLPEADFPDSFSKPAPTFLGASLAEGALHGLLGPVAFCISREETRYYLNGIMLHIQEDALRAVATDGHRLSYRDQRLLPEQVSGENQAVQFIVPRAACTLALKLPRAEVELRLGQASGEILTGDYRLQFKLIDGTYPDYKRVIPNHEGKNATVSPRLLATAAGAVMGATAEKHQAISLAFAGERLAVRMGLRLVYDSKTGQHKAKDGDDFAAATLACKPDGKPAGFGCNGSYLRDVLASFGDRPVTMHTLDEGAPVVFSAEGVSGRAVLMPMRVAAESLHWDGTSL